jgi:hypothetical protein
MKRTVLDAANRLADAKAVHFPKKSEQYGARQ